MKRKVKGYAITRDRKQAKLHPKFVLVLKELLQNIPWSEKLTNVNIRLTKVPGAAGLILLEIWDNDYGCHYYNEFEPSLLSVETEDGFTIEKKKLNKFGQGLCNMVNYSSTGQLEIQMKKDGEGWTRVMNNDEDRTGDVTDGSPNITTDSGFYVKMPLAITNKSFKINTPEKMAKAFYNTIKFDCQFVLPRVNVEFELMGFDILEITDYPDYKCLQAKSLQWLGDDLTTLSARAPHEVDKQIWTLPQSNKKFTISKIEYGKRLGQTDAKRYGISEKLYTDTRFLANFRVNKMSKSPLLSDKPIALIMCIRTGLILDYIILRSGTTGQENRNHGLMKVYIDIQEDIWGVDQTKEKIMTDVLEGFMFDKLTDIFEATYPSDKNKESAMQWWTRDKLLEGKDHNTKMLYHDIGRADVFDKSKKEKLEIVFKEDTQSKNRYDFSFFEDIDSKSIVPMELKPNPFTAPHIRQLLDYYVERKANRAIGMGLDLTDKHRNEFAKKVRNWKKGKMNDTAHFVYLDARNYGYDKLTEQTYIKKVRDNQV